LKRGSRGKNGAPDEGNGRSETFEERLTPTGGWIERVVGNVLLH